MTRRQIFVVVAALVAVVAFAAAVLFYQHRERQAAAQQAQAQAGVMVRPHSPMIGPAQAPVTVVEFFDPACEACRAFHPYVKQILAAHPRDVRLVIRYVPFHREASVTGVQILEAARAQGRFETILDALLASQPVWASHDNPAIERAWEAAIAAGLDADQAAQHVKGGSAAPLLQQDFEDLQAVGVRATPTFFINGKPLPQPDPQLLAKMVDEEVVRVGGAK